MDLSLYKCPLFFWGMYLYEHLCDGVSFEMSMGNWTLSHCLWSKSYPTLIHVLKQDSKYEMIHKWLMKNQKKWQLEHSDWKIFCDLDMSVTQNAKNYKPRSPSRQFLETVNFAFIKFFDFLVKIALFMASLLFSGDSRHAFPPGSRVRLRP